MPAMENLEALFDSIEDSIEAFSKLISPFSLSFSRFCVVNKAFSLQASTERHEFVVVLDSADRENEGDLIIAAEAVTTEQMAFMIRHTRSAPPQTWWRSCSPAARLPAITWGSPCKSADLCGVFAACLTAA